jgi:NTP pyrophosphatase (non-canonical NTP hydrolase)
MKIDCGQSRQTLKEMVDLLNKFTNDRDWGVFHTPLQLALSLNLEASEVLELFQWKSGDEIGSLIKDEAFCKRLSEEMADVFSYLLLLSDVTGIDLHEALLKKIKQNGEKYPVAASKGNAKKYTELKK